VMTIMFHAVISCDLFRNVVSIKELFNSVLLNTKVVFV